ncbi:hypothetical protein B0H14DRAFT_2636296 [Mycena olivaceomarginata]|nr:hypothetical protein B0H14DRAFT_2636296 [Mycena olivaceomarginata]
MSEMAGTQLRTASYFSLQCPEFLFWTYNVHSHTLMSPPPPFTVSTVWVLLSLNSLQKTKAEPPKSARIFSRFLTGGLIPVSSSEQVTWIPPRPTSCVPCSAYNSTRTLSIPSDSVRSHTPHGLRIRHSRAHTVFIPSPTRDLARVYDSAFHERVSAAIRVPSNPTLLYGCRTRSALVCKAAHVEGGQPQERGADQQGRQGTYLDMNGCLRHAHLSLSYTRAQFEFRTAHVAGSVYNVGPHVYAHGYGLEQQAGRRRAQISVATASESADKPADTKEAADVPAEH